MTICSRIAHARLAADCPIINNSWLPAHRSTDSEFFFEDEGWRLRIVRGQVIAVASCAILLPIHSQVYPVCYRPASYFLAMRSSKVLEPTALWVSIAQIAARLVVVSTAWLLVIRNSRARRHVDGFQTAAVAFPPPARSRQYGPSACSLYTCSMHTCSLYSLQPTAHTA